MSTGAGILGNMETERLIAILAAMIGAVLLWVVATKNQRDKAKLLAAIRREQGRLGREVIEEAGVGIIAGHLLLKALEEEDKIISMPDNTKPPSTARRRRYWSCRSKPV